MARSQPRPCGVLALSSGRSIVSVQPSGLIVIGDVPGSFTPILACPRYAAIQPIITTKRPLLEVRMVPPTAAIQASTNLTAHSPRPCNQMNAAILASRKARSNPFAQGGTTVFGKGHAV